MPRKAQINRVFGSDFPVSEVKPFADNKDWIKGVGLVGETNQPVWVRFSSSGIEVFFLCLSRGYPFFISWERVSKLKPELEEVEGLAELMVDGLSENILIPWINHKKAIKDIPKELLLDYKIEDFL